MTRVTGIPHPAQRLRPVHVVSVQELCFVVLGGAALAQVQIAEERMGDEFHACGVDDLGSLSILPRTTGYAFVQCPHIKH